MNAQTNGRMNERTKERANKQTNAALKITVDQRSMIGQIWKMIASNVNETITDR